MAIVDIGKSPKRWFRGGAQKRFKVINEPFFDFLETSALRECNCENALPIIEYTTLKNGKQRPKCVCSICHGDWYKEYDFSFCMLIYGGKGSGKTTFVLSLSDIIHAIDQNRIIQLWQCPDTLIDSLYTLKICKRYKTICQRAIGEVRWSNVTPTYKMNAEGKELSTQASFQAKEEKFRICNCMEFKTSDECVACQHFQDGLHHFEKITKFKEIKYNSVLIIDEGILNVNAKEALTKNMRRWDKLLAVLRHKRIIMFALFQREEIIKTLRELSDIMLYKALPQKLINEEKKDKFLRENAEAITKLKVSESILVSSYKRFDKIGKIMNKVPEWYGKEISMSYDSEYEFLDEEDEDNKKNLKFGQQMAEFLVENGGEIENQADKSAARALMREHFSSATPKQLSIAMDGYFRIKKYGRSCRNGQVAEPDKQQPVLNDNSTPDNAQLNTNRPVLGAANIKASQDEEVQMLAELRGNIEPKEWSVFKQWAHGKSVNDKEGLLGIPKQRVVEIVRKVGRFLLQDAEQRAKGVKDTSQGGDDAERAARNEAWESGGFAVRTVGSGGERGKVPSADIIEISPDGHVFPVQVKQRDAKKCKGDEFSLSPLACNSEMKVARRIKEIANKTSIKCPHCQEIIVGKTVGGILLPDNAYLYVTDPEWKGQFLKEKLKFDDNKKTIKVNLSKRVITRQDPDLTKVKNQSLLKFLQSDKKIYDGKEEEVKEEDPKTENDKKKDEMVDIDELYEQTETDDVEA